MPKPEAAGADTERFERLFRAHHRAVVAYVRRRAPAESVDDVVGETFLVAWRRLDRVPAEERPWLFGVARNVLATQRRGARRRQALRLRLSSTGVEPPASLPHRDSRLAAALAALSEKDREALTLIAWEGLTPHEAATALRESPAAFRVRLHRARRRLRSRLEDARPASSSGLRVKEAAHD